MLQHINPTIPAAFILITILTGWFLFKSGIRSKVIWFIIIPWLFIQAILGLNGFYKTATIPPRFAILLGIPFVFIIALFISYKGKEVIDNLDVKWLTWLHVIRIPVEIVLLCLFLKGYVPKIMTFEGRNLDILSGISAGFIAWFGIHQRLFNRRILLVWNFICLGLLLNIVTIAILSAPSPLQRFGFDQPNVAILFFPFVWLPCFVVPSVLFAHLVSIRQLLKKDINF